MDNIDEEGRLLARTANTVLRPKRYRPGCGALKLARQIIRRYYYLLGKRTVFTFHDRNALRSARNVLVRCAR